MALCSFCIGPTCRTRVSAEGLGGDVLSIGGASEASGVQQTGCLCLLNWGPKQSQLPHRPVQSKACDCLAGATFAFLRRDLHAHW
jgi:hypothetical protein